MRLPLTIQQVVRAGGGLWAVELADADNVPHTILVPGNLATAEAVTIGALAMAVLAGGPYPAESYPGGKHTRHDPRTPT